MNVFVTAFLATALSFCVVVGSGGLVLEFLRPRSLLDGVAKFYLVIGGVGALLSLNIWWPVIWLAGVIWAILLLGCWFGWTKVQRSWVPVVRGGVDNTLLGRLILVTLSAVLIVDALTAGLPVFRYDQWSYSLIISKWIAHLGTLTPPVTDDHIFFTGSFEYLGLLARVVSNSDAFQQGFQNSLSFWLVALPVGALSFESKNISASTLTAATVFMVIAVFGTGDHQGLVNAKPDFVNMMIACCLALSLARRDVKHRLSPMMVGALYVLGLSLKFTWVHFIVSSLPLAAGELIFRDKNPKNQSRLQYRPVLAACLGAVLALPLLCPVLIKNHLVFGNPFHPAQTPIAPSLIWNDRMAAYWQAIMAKPNTAWGFLENLLITLSTLPSRLQITLPVLVVLIGAVLWQQRGSLKNMDKPHRIWPVITAGTVYIATWGFFYTGRTSDRFVSPLHGLMLALIFVIWARARIAALLLLLIVAPALSVSQLEVSLHQLGLSLGAKVEDFQNSFEKSPSASNEYLRLVARHRAESHPGAKFNEAVMMSDFFHSFYAVSQNYPANAAIAWWTLSSNGIDPDRGCARELFRERNIRYVLALQDPSLSSWPGAVSHMVESMTEIPIKHGRLWYVHDFEQLLCAR